MPNTEMPDVILRLERLEKAVFGDGKRPQRIRKHEDFSGPTGGVRLLLSKEYFRAKRSLGDVRDALARNDYHYRAAPIQTALNRLSKRTGPLAASKEGGKKLYVKRK
jgi:hypothetical protein